MILQFSTTLLNMVRQNVMISVRSRKRLSLTARTGKRVHDNKKFAVKYQLNCSYFLGELHDISVLHYKLEEHLIAKLVDEHKWCCSYTDLAKSIFNNLQLKYLGGLIRIFLRKLQPNLPLGRGYGNSCSLQNSLLKIETVFFSLSLCNYNFSSLITYGISETRAVPLDQVLCIFHGSS